MVLFTSRNRNKFISRLIKIDNSNRFENSIGHNSILNELETELYKTCRESRKSRI